MSEAASSWLRLQASRNQQTAENQTVRRSGEGDHSWSKGYLPTLRKRWYTRSYPFLAIV